MMTMKFYCQECGTEVKSPLNLGVITLKIRFPVFKDGTNIGYKQKTYESGHLCEKCYGEVDKSKGGIINSLLTLKSTTEIGGDQE